MNVMPKPKLSRSMAFAALSLLLVLGACDLDEVRIPELTGPAEQGLSIDMRAVPDILNADGVSTSTITVRVHDQNGAPVGNRQLLFAVDGDGLLISGNVVVGPLQDGGQGISLGTAGNGQAQITYQAGTISGIRVWVSCRAYSFDAAGEGGPTRFVAIDQR
jgi:hypothetical protein